MYFLGESSGLEIVVVLLQRGNLNINFKSKSYSTNSKLWYISSLFSKHTPDKTIWGMRFLRKVRGMSQETI